MLAACATGAGPVTAVFDPTSTIAPPPRRGEPGRRGLRGPQRGAEVGAQQLVELLLVDVGQLARGEPAGQPDQRDRGHRQRVDGGERGLHRGPVGELDRHRRAPRARRPARPAARPAGPAPPRPARGRGTRRRRRARGRPPRRSRSLLWSTRDILPAWPRSRVGGMLAQVARVWIGTSGWRYPPWRGAFYPPGLAQRRELEYLSRQVSSIEINGSFYSLQRPESYRAWARRDARRTSCSRSRAAGSSPTSSSCATSRRRWPTSSPPGCWRWAPSSGPLLWQLPPRMRFDADRLAAFLALLPRTTGGGRAAGGRARRAAGRARATETDADRPLRHALEVRHESFRDPAFVALLREHDVALVVADSAGTWPYFEERHRRLRLRAAARRTTSSTPAATPRTRWTGGRRRCGPGAADGRDVVVYFDNDAKVHAPYDAIALARAAGGPVTADRPPGSRAA